MSEIILDNPKIIKYFDEHKNVDPENLVLFMIEILEKFGDNIIENMTSSINSQILSNILDLKQKNQMIYENLNKINQDITNSLYIKMLDIKKEYIEDVKSVISTNTNEISTHTNEKLVNIIEKNNLHLIDKTTILLNEIVPRTNQGLYNQIDDNIKNFQRTITDETHKILKSLDKDNNMKDYLNIFEQKFSIMVQNIQNPIHSFINSSEERLNTNIVSIRELTNTNTQSQERLNNELSEFLNKYKNSTYKGQIGENQLFLVLNQMFPTAEIMNTTGQKASGDFSLKRVDKPNIIIETKDYENNVYIDEIRKFIRDIETQNTHGIFLSQKSGIAARSNYQIEIHKGNILVYVHNVEYSKEKIQIAVDIIDHLSQTIEKNNLDDENENTITSDILNDINKEYQNFALQKDIIVGITKDNAKKLLSQLDEMKFPTLDKYLSLRFASIANVTRLNNQHKCDLCDFTTTTLKSLSAHKRMHNKETNQNLLNEKKPLLQQVQPQIVQQVQSQIIQQPLKIKI